MYSLTMLAASDPNVISFPKLGLEMKVNSTAFTVFGASITWYGVLITTGMMLAMLYGFARMRKFGIDTDRAIDGVIGGVIGAIIGARLYYVLFHLDEYSGMYFMNCTMDEDLRDEVEAHKYFGGQITADWAAKG